MIPFPGAGVHQLVQCVRQGRGERGPGRGHDCHPDPQEGGGAGEDEQVGRPEGDQARGGQGDRAEQEEKMLQRLKYFILFYFYNISYSQWRQESFIISFCPKLLLADGMHLWTFHE